MFGEPADKVIAHAVAALMKELPAANRHTAESFIALARQSLPSGAPLHQTAKTAKTVNGKEFTYTGTIDEGIVVQFDKSQPLRISREAIDSIRREIVTREGPALMGAIFSPLMPRSIGEAIQTKYKLSPIMLSYVIPLLRDRGEVQVFKNGRNWYVRAVNTANNGNSSTTGE
jgi:hypothetical protein